MNLVKELSKSLFPSPDYEHEYRDGYLKGLEVGLKIAVQLTEASIEIKPEEEK